MTRLRTIQAIEPKPGYRLDVTWANGTHSVVDMSDDLAAGGGIFAPLTDPTTFQSVRVGERARTIEWRVPLGDAAETLIDIDADALFEMAEAVLNRNYALSITQRFGHIRRQRKDDDDQPYRPDFQ